MRDVDDALELSVDRDVFGVLNLLGISVNLREVGACRFLLNEEDFSDSCLDDIDFVIVRGGQRVGASLVRGP